ncbi:unnamed protein product, partial [Ixodes hexagonus]
PSPQQTCPPPQLRTRTERVDQPVSVGLRENRSGFATFRRRENDRKERGASRQRNRCNGLTPCDVIAMPPRPCPEDRRRCVLLGNCLVVVCRRVDADDGECPPAAAKERGPPGWSLFRGFVHENAQCFWNQCLVQSVACLEYRGYLIPSTIFVSGNDYTLEVVRSAWARRVLRPPVGYEIQRL